MSRLTRVRDPRIAGAIEKLTSKVSLRKKTAPPEPLVNMQMQWTTLYTALVHGHYLARIRIRPRVLLKAWSCRISVCS